MLRRWINNLRIQILLLLTLALLPLGSVAIYQTNKVAQEARRNADLALLGLTERAAKAEQLAIERAFGAARFLAAIAGDFANSPERCGPDFARFTQADSSYSFIGFIPLSGIISCSSAGKQQDISDSPVFAAIKAVEGPSIQVNTEGRVSGKSVFVIAQPYFVRDSVAGYVSISIPHDNMPVTPQDMTDMGLVDLITFNSDGVVLTARSGLDEVNRNLPANRALVALAGSASVIFEDTSNAGNQTTYSVVPIDGGPATVLGVWNPSVKPVDRLNSLFRPAIFPLLMWAASMAVAMLSMHTLVLRHITKLRRDMDNFATDRTSVSLEQAHSGMPTELRDLHNNFVRMTEEVMQDEAELEDTLREKSVLIKEVHHRVKNNLQLISSIMNMQIRQAEHEETKSVLARLQDRVLSLATIHRDLYQSDNQGMVNAGNLVTEIVQKSLEMAVSEVNPVDVTVDVDRVLLFPDQAVPLSLMIAEATTNALKYLGTTGKNRPWFKVALKNAGETCSLSLSNSTGGTNSLESTGLGAQLIKAFAIQLGGTIETEVTADSYTLKLTFTVADFVPETPNY